MDRFDNLVKPTDTLSKKMYLNV